MRTCEDVLNRLRAEFLEMPGLTLTPAQVGRLCGVEQIVCGMMLDMLVAESFLCVKPDGQYARVTNDHYRRPAKADVKAGWHAKKAS